MRYERWFRRAVALVLLAVCGVTVWYTLSGMRLAAQREELLLSLETACGRERLQLKQYAAAAEELPRVQAELAAIQPLADAAKAEETALRAQRKELRAEVKSLEEAVSLAAAYNEELGAIVWSTQQIQLLMTAGSAQE